jgi:hypothetical protein
MTFDAIRDEGQTWVARKLVPFGRMDAFDDDDDDGVGRPPPPPLLESSPSPSLSMTIGIRLAA